MEVLNEKEEAMVNMEMEFSTEEIEQLVKYCDTNISKDELTTIKVEWAVNHLLLHIMEK